MHFSDLTIAKYFKKAVNGYKKYFGRKEKGKKPIEAFLDADRCDQTVTFYEDHLFMKSVCNQPLLKKVARACMMNNCKEVTNENDFGNGLDLEFFYEVMTGISVNEKDSDTHPYADVPLVMDPA